MNSYADVENMKCHFWMTLIQIHYFPAGVAPRVPLDRCKIFSWGQIMNPLQKKIEDATSYHKIFAYFDTVLIRKTPSKCTFIYPLGRV